MNAKEIERNAKQGLDRLEKNQFKSRGGRATIIMESEPVRSNSLPVINHDGKVDPDDYIDYE